MIRNHAPRKYSAEPHFLPPANVISSNIKDSIIAAGSEVASSSINRCIIGLRSTVKEGCTLENVYMMGADYYESSKKSLQVKEAGGIPIGVGAGTTLKDVIVDKNARIGANCTIVNKDGVIESTRAAEGLYIRSGIVVVAKNATVPPKTVI